MDNLNTSSFIPHSILHKTHLSRWSSNSLISLQFKSKSELLYDWRSVSQHVLVWSTLVGLAIRYYFLSECCCLKFAVLFLWGALSLKNLLGYSADSPYVNRRFERTCSLSSHLLHTRFLPGWFSTLKMEVIRSSEASVHTRTKQRYTSNPA
jgi:hypothetical protein